MEKTYSDFMNDITPEELYKGLIEFGLFSEKLPPVFEGREFYNYCIDTSRVEFTSKWHSYVSYDSIRNNNIPRNIGIPTPMSHELLCSCLRDNWDKIQQHFETTTALQTHIVSRIHIRKMKDNEALFEMNYKNWKTDGSPEPDLLINKRYEIHADISKCFPSVYTHALPWALVGKKEAKKNTSKKDLWYNKIDSYVQKTKNGETHGLHIGPHTSNILSEIILCKIDEELDNKWEYVRNIDDYCCYVENQEDADAFLVDLNRALREYGLLLNHKKTEIKELPQGLVEQWVHRIQDKALYFEKFHPYIDYLEVQSFMDYCTDLMIKNKENASIILYALKVLKGCKLTENAKLYLSKRAVALAIQFPYIIPVLDECIFVPCNVEAKAIEKYVNSFFEVNFNKNNFDACSYALLYATKYNCVVSNFNIDDVLAKKDCILAVMAMIYCRKKKNEDELKKLRAFAKKLKADGELEENWIFVYECLPYTLLAEDWKKMKQAGVSFLKQEFR